MTKDRARRGLLACGLAVAGLLMAAPSAFAHAIVSPPVAKSGVDQVFTLTVPNEKKGVTVTKVEMTVPSGAGIDSFEDAPGWTRTEQTEGEEISSVTWEGGATPEGDMAVFRWQGALSAAQTYTFQVTETYSDGSVVEWTGDPSAETRSHGTGPQRLRWFNAGYRTASLDVCADLFRKEDAMPRIPDQ